MNKKKTRSAASDFARIRDAAIFRLKNILEETKEKRCDETCPGWFLSSEDGRIHRCDDCAHRAGYDRHIFDEDFAILPAAIKAVYEDRNGTKEELT